MTFKRRLSGDLFVPVFGQLYALKLRWLPWS